MSDSSIEYLQTKDGKKTPQELAVATDLAITCSKCGKRKTMFLKAAFCEVCKLLWFYMDIERLGPAKKMAASPQAMSFSELERERLFFIIENAGTEEFETQWHKHLKEKSEDMYQEFLTLTKWTPPATDKKLGARGGSS